MLRSKCLILVIFVCVQTNVSDMMDGWMDGYNLSVTSKDGCMKNLNFLWKTTVSDGKTAISSGKTTISCGGWMDGASIHPSEGRGYKPEKRGIFSNRIIFLSIIGRKGGAVKIEYIKNRLFFRFWQVLYGRFRGQQNITDYLLSR